MQVFVIAFRNLQRRTVRTLFALLGVAVGVSIVVSIFVSAGSLQRQFTKMAQEFRGDLIVTKKNAFLPIQSLVSESTATKLNCDPSIERVSLLRIWRQPLENQPGLRQPVVILGLRAGDLALERYPITKGRGLTQNDSDTILVGEILARDFGYRLGQTVKILGADRKIVGLFQSPLEGVQFLSGGVIMPLDEMCRAQLKDRKQITGNLALVHVNGKARDGKNYLKLLDYEKRVQATAKLLGDQFSDYKAQPISEYLSSFNSQVEIVEKFALAISLLALLAGGIGIMNTMIMSVFERTREIGLLKALGWPKGMIMSMIMIEGGVLSVLGGLFGIPLGLIEVKLSTALIKLGVIHVDWDTVLFLKIILLATVVGILGSIYPALRAAYLAPTEALRYE